MLTIRDSRGTELRFEQPPRRIVSLVPSITETLFDLGAGGRVAGLTTYCIFPSEARAAAVDVGGTKNPHVDRIRALEPDLVLMNLEENLKRHADEIEKFAPLHVSEPKNVDDVRRLLEDLGAIFDRPAAARDLVKALDAARAELRTIARPFRFACPIWKESWMWCGADTYVSALVSEAGGTNVCDELRYPALTVDEVLARSPETLFLPDEPYPFTEDDAASFRPRGVTVVGPFPGHLFTWHGTRTTAGLRFLRDVMLSQTV